MSELKKLSKLFYNPKIGLINQNKLYEKSKLNNINITHKELKDFYESQPVNQVLKRITKNNKFNSFRASYINEIWQIDLLIYDRFKIDNYKYIFVV